MTALDQAKENYIADIGGLAVSIAGRPATAQFPIMAVWQEVEAVPGMFMRPIPVPDDLEHDYFMNRGSAGVHAHRISVPQAARFTLLRGLMRFAQASQPEMRVVHQGETVSLGPGEWHSYELLDYCVFSLVLTPPLSYRYD